MSEFAVAARQLRRTTWFRIIEKLMGVELRCHWLAEAAADSCAAAWSGSGGSLSVPITA